MPSDQSKSHIFVAGSGKRGIDKSTVAIDCSSNLSHLHPIAQKNVMSWLRGNYPDQVKSSILGMLKKDPQKIEDAFYTCLSFGTGGMRGLMGLGTNRLNVYTVRAAAQGLANYILKQDFHLPEKAVFIGYDSRHCSKQFAEETAKVCAGNGITVFFCLDFCPTPLVSYGCRYKDCIAGVMITASHNPPEYNGIKVFWSDGGQVLSPHDEAIRSEISKVSDPDRIKAAHSLSNPLIIPIRQEIVSSYINEMASLQNFPESNKQNGSQLKIIYTSLHGVGDKIVPQALNSWGFNHVELVENQIIPDGSFPTIKSPNPEDAEALHLGIRDLLHKHADILIATDPDVDRVAIAVRHDDQAIVLTGNQVASLILDHLCETLAKRNRLPQNAVFIKTIGTSELFQTICNYYQRPCINVLTGFKYIAEKIRLWEKSENGFKFLFGCEESLGYLIGTLVRDKDAVSSACLISEIALQAKLSNKTMIDKLHELFAKYGIYQEKSLSIDFKDSTEAKSQILACMEKLRDLKIDRLARIPISVIEDYQNSTRIFLKNAGEEKMEMPKSNVLLFKLEDGSRVMVRPSGTEPKIKLSCCANERNYACLSEGINKCLEKCDALIRACHQLTISSI